MTECYFCDERGVAEQHHIVPRRFGGSDDDENLVSVCPTCHSKLESLYDKRFYDALEVEKENDEVMPTCEFCSSNRSVGQVCRFYPGSVQSYFCCDECADENDYSLSLRVDE